MEKSNAKVNSIGEKANAKVRSGSDKYYEEEQNRGRE